MRFRKILHSPTSTNHSLNVRSPLRNDELQFWSCGAQVPLRLVSGLLVIGELIAIRFSQAEMLVLVCS